MKPDQVDTVTVSAVVHVPNAGLVPDAARAAAERVKVKEDGRVAVGFALQHIETNDNAKRQDELSQALDLLWKKLVRADLLSVTGNPDVVVILAITLTPAWGQASISISPDSLKHWIEVGAFLHIDAWPG